ncbi:MAG TPA: acetyl-CoA carboxylase biotin carboxyl carrier protein [Tepidisphaeraceae bacterium]|nr:acetyl-CoA carboxylase biotin carboxyl carrier protein [Tepidisphaeraceae bacterium]
MSKNKPNKNKPAPRKPAPTSDRGPMSIELLSQITALMKDNDLNMLDVRDGERRIVLQRGGTFVAAAPQAPSYAPPAAPVVSPAGNSSAASNTAPVAPSDEKDLVPINSPMVGTFYSSPTPDAKAFVSVGSTVNTETDVCIIEAMKVFNNIKAETNGVIAKILVNNGQTVEFNQPLFLVRPS